MTTCRTNSGASCKRKPCVKCHWRREEDDLLTLLVRVNGPGKWDQIAARIPGRTGKSCRIRWINQLNPRVDKAPFSAQENRRLLQLHREYGNRWSTIATYFPGRTDNQVKNQYHVLSGSRYVRALALASASSSCTDPFDKGSSGLSQNQNTSMVPVDSPFMQMGLSFIGGPSSVYGQCDSHGPDPSDGDSVNSHRRICRGNSVVSDANSAEVEELCSVPQLQQGMGIGNYQFIDFLGVGGLE